MIGQLRDLLDGVIHHPHLLLLLLNHLCNFSHFLSIRQQIIQSIIEVLAVLRANVG